MTLSAQTMGFDTAYFSDTGTTEQVANWIERFFLPMTEDRSKAISQIPTCITQADPLGVD